MRGRGRFTRRAGLAFAAALLATPALAHSTLRRASPAEGSRARGPVTEIRLTFSQGVEAALSTATLTRDGQKMFENRAFEAAPNDGAVLLLRLPEALAPGSYRLDWRAMSIDTHMVQGRLGFAVAP